MLDRQVSSGRTEPPAARRASEAAPGVARTAAPAAGAHGSPPSGPAPAASSTDWLGGVLARAVAQRAGKATPPLSRPLLQRFYARGKGGGMPAWQPEPLDPTKWRDSGEWTTWWWIPYRIYEPIDPEPTKHESPPEPQPKTPPVDGSASAPPQPESETSGSVTPDPAVGEPRQPDAQPSRVMEDLPQMAHQRTLNGGEHFNALVDFRAAQAQAIADYVKRRDATPSPAVVTPQPAVATPQPAAGGFDAAAAQALLSVLAPGAATAAYDYLGRVDEGALAASGFDWADQDHIAILQAALDAVHERARAAAARAAAADAEAVRLRNERFDPDNPDTWQLNPLGFVNGVTEEDVNTAGDGPGILDTIRRATLRANGPRGRIPIAANKRFHTHISSGSWGVSFIYIVEADMTVTPYVYDIAQSRLDNVYDWRNGSKSSGNSDARLPRPKPA